jgi:hypothetical protein
MADNQITKLKSEKQRHLLVECLLILAVLLLIGILSTRDPTYAPAFYTRSEIVQVLTYGSLAIGLLFLVGEAIENVQWLRKNRKQ